MLFAHNIVFFFAKSESNSQTNVLLIVYEVLLRGLIKRFDFLQEKDVTSHFIAYTPENLLLEHLKFHYLLFLEIIK